MSETVQALSDLGVVGIALLVMLLAVYGWIQSRKLDQSIRLRDKDIEKQRYDNETLKIKADQQVEIVRAEASNNTALASARFMDFAERQERQNERMLIALQDVATSNTQRTEAIKQQTATLDSFSQYFSNEVGGMKNAINAAGEQMMASREATDSRLSSIQAGVEYGNKAIDDTKAVIETLPQDTTKVVIEIGDKALTDHRRIQEAVDGISKQLEALPTYLVKSLTPFIEELRTANQQLQDTQNKLIEVVKTVMPPREVVIAAESTPINERTG